MAIKITIGAKPAEALTYELYMGERQGDEDDDSQFFVVARGLEEAQEQYRAVACIDPHETYRIWKVDGASVQGPARALNWFSDVTGGDWVIHE